jgi:hypothetical protein
MSKVAGLINCSTTLRQACLVPIISLMSTPHAWCVRDPLPSQLTGRVRPQYRLAHNPRYIQTPLDPERNVGLLRGNIMHIDMSLDQMFMFRPLPELAMYKTPLSGLYLTGASAHPGGGVSGASGRNAASAVLRDLRARPHNWRGWALGAATGAALLTTLALRHKRRPFSS